MTAVADATVSDKPAAGAALVTGVILAALAEAIASTALSLGRVDIIGDVHATPDEFAWLDIGYIALKLIGFVTTPWLMSRISPRRLVIASSLIMAISCGLSVITAQLELLVAFRVMQGFAGGAILVAGQGLLFLGFPQSRQPILQALFAVGAVVAPATIAPAFQGWLLDAQSWTSIFFSAVPMALAAVGLLLLVDDPSPAQVSSCPFDWTGFSLISVALFCFTYVLSQGTRWNWFEEPAILWLTLTGAGTAFVFVIQQVLARGRGLLDFSAFGVADFSFAFVVSFVAGAALFGSAFLIPSFAVSVLSFTPTDAGLLLLPSGMLFLGALLISAFLIQVRRTPPIATVPFGIGMIMLAMWTLSGSTSESGAQDMMGAILLRGLGLGFLFLSITLIAFNALNRGALASGIGLFNVGRQVGGLAGIAALQTLIDHDSAYNFAVLGANVVSGAPFVSERLTTTTAVIASNSLDTAAASRIATSLLAKATSGQGIVIAFDSAFIAIALLFVVAAPVVITVRLALSRRDASQARTTLGEREPDLRIG